MSKSVLKRLRKVEKKIAEKTEDIKEQERVADLELLLESYSYQQMQKEMIMTPEEKRKDDEQDIKQVLEWYALYQELSPEEQKRQNEIQDIKIAKELEQFRVWLNSEERRQFDIEYAEKQQVTKSDE